MVERPVQEWGRRHSTHWSTTQGRHACCTLLPPFTRNDIHPATVYIMACHSPRVPPSQNCQARGKIQALALMPGVVVFEVVEPQLRFLQHVLIHLSNSITPPQRIRRLRVPLQRHNEKMRVYGNFYLKSRARLLSMQVAPKRLAQREHAQFSLCYMPLTLCAITSGVGLLQSTALLLTSSLGFKLIDLNNLLHPPQTKPTNSSIV